MKVPILISLFLACSMSGAALAQSQLSTSVAFDYFSTTENYADDGSGPESLPGNNSYSNLQMIFEADWKASKVYALEAGIIMARAESVTPTLKRDQLNPSKIYGGVRPRLYNGKFEVWGLGRGYFSLVPVDLATADVLIGEGDHGVEVGGEVIRRFRRGIFRLESFIRYPDQERAVLLPFDVSWNHAFAGAYSIRGRFFGETGIINDKYTNDKLQRRAVTSYVSAGSYRYYSINPSFYAVGADFFWKLTYQSMASVGLATTVSGKSSAKGTSVLASYTWYWGRTERGSVEFIDRSGERAKKREQDFKLNEEEYDENLFKD